METMKKSKVIEILTFYRNIDGEIKMYRATVDDLEGYYEPSNGKTLDAMPKAKYNVSNPTETMAINLPDRLADDIRDFNGKINMLYRLKTEILKEVSTLELKYKAIITDYYLHGLKWEQVSTRNHYSERQCKNIRDTAIDNLAVKFGENRIIAEFGAKK